MHEFQNLHSMYKARIQEFIRGHFYGYAFTFQNSAMVVQHYLKKKKNYQKTPHQLNKINKQTKKHRKNNKYFIVEVKYYQLSQISIWDFSIKI